MGAKAVIAMMVAPSKGHFVCLTTELAACNLVMPRCKPMSMPSVTTMALSTSIPSAMMSPPREIRCKLIWK